MQRRANSSIEQPKLPVTYPSAGMLSQIDMVHRNKRFGGDIRSLIIQCRSRCGLVVGTMAVRYRVLFLTGDTWWVEKACPWEKPGESFHSRYDQLFRYEPGEDVQGCNKVNPLCSCSWYHWYSLLTT